MSDKEQLSGRERARVLIACKMIRNELEHIMKASPYAGEIVWVDKKLHEVPENLKEELQKQIDRFDRPDTDIVLAFGLCGNAVVGLRAQKARLILPNFDDCLRALLSEGPGMPIRYDPRALLYTDGWMDREDCLLFKRDAYVERYGEKKGMKVLRLMLKNYNQVQFLDTGLYDPAECAEQIRPVTEELNLAVTERKVSLTVYEKLIAGDYDSEFLIIEPDTVVTQAHFDGRAVCVFV